MHPLMRILVLWLTLFMLGGLAHADQLTNRFNATKKLAEKGQPDAMYQLGQMYELGMGVTPDTTIGYAWYQKAATKGQPDAAYQIGYAYYWGKAGQSKDRKTAFQWFTKAAGQGNRAAMTYLSKMYSLGQGTTRDKEQAAVWADRARVAERQALDTAQSAATSSKPAQAKPRQKKSKPVPLSVEQTASTVQPKKATQAAKSKANVANAATPKKAASRKTAADKKKSRPAKAKPSTPDRVLASGWQKGKRPATFLPSENTECKKAEGVLRCSTSLITDYQYGTPFRYRYISTLSDFKRKGTFKVDYKAQLIEVLAKEVSGYSAAEGEEEALPEVTSTTINQMLSRRQDELSCEFTDKNSIVCIDDRGKRQQLSRSSAGV